MRLTESLKKEILTSAKVSFGDVPIYLFGSRTDDSKKGGDIDLAIQVTEKRTEFNQRKLRFLTDLEKRGIDYPFDIVQYNNDTAAILKKEIEKSRILLS